MSLSGHDMQQTDEISNLLLVSDIIYIGNFIYAICAEVPVLAQ